MKYPRFFVGNQELKLLNITQNEHASLWGGYLALDFGWGTFGDVNNFCNSPITTPDTDIKVVETYWSGTATSSYLIIEYEWTDGWHKIQLAHTDNYPALWTIIAKGQKICKPSIVNTNAPHLHICGSRNGADIGIRDYIFNNSEPVDDRPRYKKNTKVVFVAPTNIRSNYGTSSDVIGSTTNGIANIQSDDVKDSDGFLWQNLKFLDCEGWSYTGNMKETDKQVSNSDGTYPEPEPEPEKTCCKKLKEIEDILHNTQELLKLEAVDKQKAIVTQLDIEQKYKDKIAELEKVKKTRNLKIQDFTTSELFAEIWQRVRSKLSGIKD